VRVANTTLATARHTLAFRNLVGHVYTFGTAGELRAQVAEAVEGD
jgi:hypothetical protein